VDQEKVEDLIIVEVQGKVVEEVSD